MREIVDSKKCSGCASCFNACPQHCIKMQPDNDGFLRPVIDSDICVDCGMCQQACPILSEYKGNPKGKAYACINKDDDIRMKSSSGGIFSLLAEHILDCGGVVFGAALDDDLSVHHIEVANVGGLEKLRGTKYVQSRIEYTYKAVKENLEAGKKVLFTGTPCQISGLKAYLRKDYENLYTQDLICHGVPSPAVWQKYLRFREKSAGAGAKEAFFRCKKYGWRRYSVLLGFANSKEYIKTHSEDLYIQAFISNLCLRPSCYNCHSKSVERESDITLADFWGVAKVCPEFFDDKGTSLVLINTSKGGEIFNEISSKMTYKEVDIDEALKFNSAAYQSATAPESRERFMQLVNEMPFDKAVKACLKKTFKRKVLGLAKRLLARVIKR